IVRTAEWAQGALLRREPTLPSEPVRMATTRMEYDDSRARTELGYSSIPAREALVRAVRWYLDHGLVKPSRAERIRRAPALTRGRDLGADPGESYNRERLATCRCCAASRGRRPAQRARPPRPPGSISGLCSPPAETRRSRFTSGT